MKTAARLLAHEGTDASAAAAGRVYDKLHEHLAPLLGDDGVQMLFVRSAKLSRDDLAAICGGSSAARAATSLRERLRSQDPPLDAEAATLLFGTFFALITTFIGERLVAQVLRRAWPMVDGTGFGETT